MPEMELKIKILKVYEKGGILRVLTETPYGKDNLGLSLEKKYLDTDGVPKWKREVKRLLEQKYGKQTSVEKPILEEEWDKEYKWEDFAKPESVEPKPV